MSGLPKVVISFKEKANKLIRAVERGVVLCIVKDTSKKTEVFKSAFEASKHSNTKIKTPVMAIFEGGVKKVIVECVNENNALNAILEKYEKKKINWICYPGATNEEYQTIATFIKSARDTKDLTLKAVVFNHAADHEGIVNFTTETVTDRAGETISGADYTARICGVLAGMEFSRSATYYVLDELESAKEKADPDALIKAGELILVDNGEKVRIARAVTSLVDSNNEKPKSYKKIKLVEAADKIKDDIRTTFEDDYVGKTNNTYTNKMLFVGLINSVYFKELEGEVLSDGYDNHVKLDFEYTKRSAIEQGADVEKMTDAEIIAYPTGSTIALVGAIKLVDAVEDLQINFTI